MLELLKTFFNSLLSIGEVFKQIAKLFIDNPELRFLLIPNAIIFFVIIIKKIARKLKNA